MKGPVWARTEERVWPMPVRPRAVEDVWSIEEIRTPEAAPWSADPTDLFHLPGLNSRCESVIDEALLRLDRLLMRGSWRRARQPSSCGFFLS